MMHATLRLLSTLLAPLLLTAAASACGGEQARDRALRAAVDSLLPGLERLSGLPARNPINLGTKSKAEVRQYVTEQLDKELPAAELRGIQGTYAAFGLIPDTLDLRKLLLELYAEQVAGYYDPEAKTFYLVEGTPRETLRPVLAHELVHALQDQHVNLDSLISNRSNSDLQTAAQAAVEGQATLVMFALMAEEMSGDSLDVTTLPDLGVQLRPALEMQNEQFPVFRGAPLILRETLLFPYLQGAAFVQALWRSRGRRNGIMPAPLDSLLPYSTEQVMHPARAFLTTRDEPDYPKILPEIAPAGWTKLYQNTLGELETSILLRQHLGGDANKLAEGWDGDSFQLLERAGLGRALVWFSVWDDAAAADRFADAYRRIAARRPARHVLVERLTVGGKPLVRVLDADFPDLNLLEMYRAEMSFVGDFSGAPRQ
jgi:hypothetical protein